MSTVQSMVRIGLLTAMAAAMPVEAAVIVGGSSLLDAAYAGQIQTWLGEGSITLTNIYTKQAGDDSFDFHNAVDGKGRTIVVMSASEGITGNVAVIGGYNPLSWSSAGSYNVTANPSDRTGFVFNLSLTQFFAQRTTAFTGGSWAGGDSGYYQTANWGGYGPTFGGGHDIWVDSTLSGGYSHLWSYNDDDAPVTGKSLIDGSPYNGADIRYAMIEVFTISPGPTVVPTPATLPLTGLALAALAAIVAPRRRTRR